MDRGPLVDGCLPRWILATLVITGCCLAPIARGQQPPLSRPDVTASETGVLSGTGKQVSNAVSSAIATLPSSTANPLDTSFLREVEQRVLPSPIVPGPNRYAELTDYYWAENRLLRDRFALAKQTFQRKPRPTFRALTLVAGAAGVGKTFIKKEVFDKNSPAKVTCKFDIRELYDAWALDGVTADKADLAHSDLVINRVKSVTDKSQPRLREYLEAEDANFYVIDSLDEIHPDDYAWVLEQIEDFVFHRNRRFVHVAMFGRGFAFRDFWQRQTEHRGETDVELYLLNPPSFRTSGDLMVSNWNYHTWKYRLAWAPDGNETVKMPLAAYSTWSASGLPRDGKFRSITYEANDDIRDDVQTTLAKSASQSRVVCSALYNLAGNSIVREILRRVTLEHGSSDDRRIAEEYLAAWLVRETKVHDRPSAEKPKHLELYLSQLGHVAVKYLVENKIDSQGFFSVGDDHTVTVEHEGRRLDFPVKRILEQSGLIVTDPREKGDAKYRFEPIWIHRLLVEMHAGRMAERPRIVLGSGAN